MRFSCESCGAQYMISDEKIGPGGVKVRCKKCGDVIRVRPAGAAEADTAARAESTPGAAATQVEPMQGEPTPVPPAQAEGGEGAEAAAEWYVAIDERQVGPLHGAALRKRWDAGEIGPDTLAWRAGMADWSPLSTIPELARRLAAAPAAVQGAGTSTHLSEARPATAGVAPAGSVNRAVNVAANGGLNGTVNGKVTTWQPTAGNALASLASQELVAAQATTPAQAAKASSPAAADAPRSGASLLENVSIPEGGVDPTHLIPLPMQGVEKTTEVVLKPKTVAEHEPTQIRQLKKSARRSGMAWGVTVATVAAVAIGAAFWYLNAPSNQGASVARAPAEPRPSAAAPTPAATPAPEPAPATPPAAAAAATPPAAPPAAAPVAAPATPAPEPARVAEAPAKVEPTQAAPAPQPEKAVVAKRPRKENTVKEPSAAKKAAAGVAVAAAAAPPPATTKPPRAAPASQPAASSSGKGGDPLLDAAEGDLEKELASSKPKRNVYVPPAIGAALPEQVSVSQINEAVVGQKAALLRCIEEQRSVDPKASGTLKMRWVIVGDGSTKDVRVASDEFAKQPIAPCITNVVKGIRFPRSQTTGQEVVFPFKF